MGFFAKTKYCICCHNRIHLVGDQAMRLPESEGDEIICGDCYKKVTTGAYEEMMHANTREEADAAYQRAVSGLAKYWFDTKGDRYVTQFYDREKAKCLEKIGEVKSPDCDTNPLTMLNPRTMLVSACLLGVNCRYNGIPKANDKVLTLLENKNLTLIPVCPEQLGGLPTPRVPSERCGDLVVNAEGIDVTEQYRRGAEEALKLAKLYQVDGAILKAKSPSCGCGKIYDGTFAKVLCDGDGVTTQYLKENDIPVMTEEDL